MPGAEYHTVYNANVYPILEIEDDNKKVKVAIPYLYEKFNLERGDEIQVIYPKGKVEKLKIYSNEDIYKLLLFNNYNRDSNYFVINDNNLKGLISSPLLIL